MKTTQGRIPNFLSKANRNSSYSVLQWRPRPHIGLHFKFTRA